MRSVWLFGNYLILRNNSQLSQPRPYPSEPGCISAAGLPPIANGVARDEGAGGGTRRYNVGRAAPVAPQRSAALPFNVISRLVPENTFYRPSFLPDGPRLP